MSMSGPSIAPDPVPASSMLLQVIVNPEPASRLNILTCLVTKYLKDHATQVITGSKHEGLGPSKRQASHILKPLNHILSPFVQVCNNLLLGWCCGLNVKIINMQAECDRLRQGILSTLKDFKDICQQLECAPPRNLPPQCDCNTDL